MAQHLVTGSITTKHGISVLWKIPDYFDLRLEDSCVFQSPFFYFVGNECQLHMYAWGKYDVCHPGWISLVFFKEPTRNWGRRFIHIKMGIENPDETKFKVWSDESVFRKDEVCRRTDEFVERIDLLRNREFIAPAGVLRVFCTLSTHDRSVVAMDKMEKRALRGLKELSQNFSHLFLNEHLSDVVIRIQNKSFPSHRAVLAARSPVFQAMLEHDTREKSSGVIEICDCTPVVFEEFLQYLYSGRSEQVSLRHVCDVYRMADKYDVRPLKTLCVAIMAEGLHVDNFCDVISLATKHGETELIDIASDFFVKNAKIILPTEKWQNFMAENLIMANELFLRTLSK